MFCSWIHSHKHKETRLASKYNMVQAPKRNRLKTIGKNEKTRIAQKAFFAPLTWHDLFKQATNVHHPVGTKLRFQNTGELQVAQFSWKDT